MPTDIRRVMAQVVENAITAQQSAHTQPEPPAKQPRLSTGRAMMLGAGLMVAGRALVSERGREALTIAWERVEPALHHDEGDPDDEYDDDGDDEYEDDPEAEYDDDGDDEYEDDPEAEYDDEAAYDDDPQAEDDEYEDDPEAEYDDEDPQAEYDDEEDEADEDDDPPPSRRRSGGRQRQRSRA